MRTPGSIDAMAESRTTVPLVVRTTSGSYCEAARELIVGADGDGAPVAVEHAERALPHWCWRSRLRTSSMRQAHGGERDRIDPHADRRLLGAVDGDLGDAVDLGQSLRDHGVGGVVKSRSAARCSR